MKERIYSSQSPLMFTYQEQGVPDIRQPDNLARTGKYNRREREGEKKGKEDEEKVFKKEKDRIKERRAIQENKE